MNKIYKYVKLIGKATQEITKSTSEALAKFSDNSL